MELGNILQNLIYRDEMVYTTSGDYSFECGQDVVVCSEHGYPTGLDNDLGIPRIYYISIGCLGGYGIAINIIDLIGIETKQ